MVPIEGTEEQKISALHEKLTSGGVSEEDLAALREQAQAATKIQVRAPPPGCSAEYSSALPLTTPSNRVLYSPHALKSHMQPFTSPSFTPPLHRR